MWRLDFGGYSRVINTVENQSCYCLRIHVVSELDDLRDICRSIWSRRAITRSSRLTFYTVYSNTSCSTDYALSQLGKWKILCTMSILTLEPLLHPAVYLCVMYNWLAVASDSRSLDFRRPLRLDRRTHASILNILATKNAQNGNEADSEREREKESREEKEAIEN